jgi:hypothetical protein
VRGIVFKFQVHPFPRVGNVTATAATVYLQVNAFRETLAFFNI